MTLYDPQLMSRFLCLINPNPRFSARFVPKAVRRRGYDTGERKVAVLEQVERRTGGVVDVEFDTGSKGRNLVGVPLAEQKLAADPFLLRGDLLAVSLAHDDGTCQAIFIDLDVEQIKNGGLAVVTGALDANGVRYLTEISPSGLGVHLWIILGDRLSVERATAWISNLLFAAGVAKKKSKVLPGHYDQVKPSGGDGGLVIVPHFLSNGRSCLATIERGVAVPMRADEAAMVLGAFKQCSSIPERVRAYQPNTTKQRTQATTSTVVSSASGELLRGLRPLTEEEIEDEVHLLKVAVENNERLGRLAAAASAASPGGRSEAAYSFFTTALLQHLVHPDGVVRYAEGWPRYSDETSLQRELLRVITKQRSEDFLLRIHGLRPTSITRDCAVSMDKDAYLQELREYAASLVSTLSRVSPRVPRRLLGIFVLPTGGEKSTVYIPTLARQLVLALRDRPGLVLAVRRERRDDVLAMEAALNIIEAGKPVTPEGYRALRQYMPKITAESYQCSPRVVLGLSSATDASAVTAVATMGFKAVAECQLANGGRADKRKFRELMAHANRLSRQPCVSGCPRSGCRMHPAYVDAHLKLTTTTRVLVVTHESQRAPPVPFSIWDERPKKVLQPLSMEVTKSSAAYAVDPLDRVLKILDFVGLDNEADELRAVRRCLTDAFDEAAKSATDAYRIKCVRALRWAAGVESICERILKGDNRGAVVEYVRDHKLYDFNRGYLDTLVRDDIETIAYLCSGVDAAWFWTANGPRHGLRVHAAKNNWAEKLALGSDYTAIFDATACTHFDYAALPEVDRAIFRFAPPVYPNLTITVDDRITKGAGTANVPEQADYVVRCLDRLLATGHAGDVLVVTHEKAEAAIAERIRQDRRLTALFDVSPPGQRTGGRSRRLLYLAHFGGITGSNQYRQCSAVIITHMHNIPPETATALALGIFSNSGVLRATCAGGLVHDALPRVWTPIRRGNKGKNKLKRALSSQHLDVSYSPEVNYVKHAHLATEIVQAIMRCRLREDASCPVRVFVPLGQQTELVVALLRELPGAKLERRTENGFDADDRADVDPLDNAEKDVA